jgi:enoyl-CoA hydratase/carnithine racemase
MELGDKLFTYRKVIIAAVNGFALGGGLQLVQAADIVLIAKSAKVGFPEICIGTIPGVGGTQRMAHFAGKAAAMEAILTGPSSYGR